MGLSEISIRRPVFAWMIMFALIIFGGIAFLRMGISQLPDADFPVVSVSVTLQGAAPEIMESEVADVIEDAVTSIEGVTNVSSTSSSGSTSVKIEFDLNRDINQALQDVQNKIASVERNLPKDIDPPQINKTNPEDQPILWMTLESKTMDMRDLMLFVKNKLKDQFSTVAGVGDVIIGGYVEPNLRIWVSDKKLNQYALTVNDVIDAIQKEHAELPAGQIQDAKREYNVRTLGEAKNLDEFKEIVINTRGGRPNYRPIKLKEVADVEEGLADVRRISRSMGNPALGLGIRKQRGTNAVALAHAVKERMKEVQKTLPEGMQLNVIFDSTRFIEESVGELNFTLLLSAILTSIVCYLFLGSWTSTLNVLMAIPTSIVGTFIVLSFAGFTLNLFTLLGLSLAIGIVVDDAIMVLENIIRHKEMGKDKVEAALDGSREITFAAIAATVSIIAIFLPVVFMKGVIGKFFYQFGITMTTAVLLSLLEALTLTPMRCSQFVDAGHSSRIGRWMDGILAAVSAFYKKALQYSLDHRKTVLVGSLIFFLVSMFSVKFLRKELIPAEDQGRFMLRVTTPVGSSINYTDEKVKELEAFFKTLPMVDRYYLAIGGFGGGDVNSAICFITMKNRGKRGINPKTNREWTQEDAMDAVRKFTNKVPDVKGVVQDLSMRGFTSSRGFPVEFTIRGPDFEKLGDYTDRLTKEMEKTGFVTDIDSDFLSGAKEVQVFPERVKAAARGVSIRDIGQTINAAVGGALVGRYTVGGRRYDIRLRLAEQVKNDPERIRELYIRNNEGTLGRLGEVVSIEQRPALPSINRIARERAISVYANITKGASQAAVNAKIEELAKKILPPPYRAVFSGSSQAMKDSFSGLLFAMLLGFVVAYMVLASQFNSFIDPVVVLLAMPFSLTGAFLGLLVTGQSLNMYSFIGLILLMGIVKKNSILLVDFTNQVLEQKKIPAREALLEACPIRLRPILMTSIATIAGAIPAALAIGPGAESRAPMAMTVIGGVLVSTVLTLVVVPAAYLSLAKFSKKAKKAHEHSSAKPEGERAEMNFVH